MFEKRMNEIKARKEEIRGMLETAKDEELNGIQEELRALDEEQKGLEKRAAIAKGINEGTIQGNPVPTPAAQPQKRSFAEMSQEELLGSSEYRSAYLKKLQGKQLNDEERAALFVGEQRALTTASGSAGAAVPTTTFNMIIEKLKQTSVLFPLINTTYIPGNVVLPVENASIAAVWSDEASEGSIGDDTVAGVSLAGFTLAKYAKISAAAMVMTIDAFESYITTQLTNQLSIAIENAIITGKGPSPSAPNKPQPTGIVSGITWTVGTNAKEYTTTLTYDDLVDARALLKSPYRPNAVWVLNSNMEAALMKIKTSTGKPIFSQDPANGFAPRILNNDYIVDDYMEDDTLLFGNLKYYYMNFSQSPIIEMSKEAGFTSASTLYRGLLIADGKPAQSEAFIKISKAS